MKKKKRTVRGFSKLFYKGKELKGEAVGVAPWEGIERNDDDAGEPMRYN